MLALAAHRHPPRRDPFSRASIRCLVKCAWHGAMFDERGHALGRLLLESSPAQLCWPRRHMQLQPGLFLQIAEYTEQIPGLRVAARSEHADEALGLCAGRLAQLLEADRRLDVVAQDRLPGVDVAG